MHLPEPVQWAFAKLDQPTDAYVRNYLTLRKLIGTLGLALPVVLYAGARWLRKTLPSSLRSLRHHCRSSGWARR